MAESSPSGSNVLHVKWKCLNPKLTSHKRHLKRNSKLPKQDCTSPSPIETVCSDSALGDDASGTPFDSSTTVNDLGPLSVRWDRYRLSRRSRRPEVQQMVPENIEKNSFLNELGLGECDEDRDIDNALEGEELEEGNEEEEQDEQEVVEEEEIDDEEENVSEKEEEETWEECSEEEEEEEEEDEDSLSAEENPEEEDNDISREEQVSETEVDLSPKSYLVKRSGSGTIFRNIKKRRLDVDGGAPGGSGRTTAASTSDGAWWKKKTASHTESERESRAPYEIEDKENSLGAAFEDAFATEVLSSEACLCMGAGDVDAGNAAGISARGRSNFCDRGVEDTAATTSSASSINMADDLYSSGSSAYGGDTVVNCSVPSSPGTSLCTNLTDKKLPPRLVIPTKENPPPRLHDWLMTFVGWTNPERLLAINQLISQCQPTQVRHMMKVIEPQFQRDFISLLPREVALKVLSFLEPRDLFKAAQTCRSWRFLADDNLLWKNKCRQAGIHNLPKRRFSSKSVLGSQSSAWKAAYMRQQAIEMNWRTKPIRPPKKLKGHDDHVITCLQFCGNRIVSGSDDNTLKVWSAVTGKCLRTLIGHTGGVWSSQMSGTTIISGSTDRTLKVWDAESGICRHTLQGHTSTVRCMHLHGHKVVSGSRDATLRVWNVETGDCLHILVGHQAAVRCVQYDGKLVVSGAYDCLVKVWNPEREECLHTLSGHTNRVYSLQFDGVHVVSGSLDTSIRVWEVETGACKHTLMGHQSLTSGMELRNNILVSGNADSTVKVWDILTGQCLQTLSGANKHNSAVTCLQFNSRFVITSSDDGTVKLWDVRTGEFIRNLVALHSGGSGGVVWRIRANDTKLVCAVGSRNGTEETKLLVLDFEVHSNDSVATSSSSSSSSPIVGITDTSDNGSCHGNGNDSASETIVIRPQMEMRVQVHNV